MKRTVEIDDNLDEIVESACEDVKQELLDFLEANPDQDELPCLNNDLDYSGAIHEITDSAVPCYTYNLKSLYFLYENALDQAFDNAGCSTRDEAGDNYIAQAVYFYIQEQINEWYQENAQDIFDEWLSAKTFTYTVKDGQIEVKNSNDEFVVGASFDQYDNDIDEFRDYFISVNVLPKDARLEEV